MGYTTSFMGCIALSRKLTLREAKRWLDVCDEISEGDTSLKPNTPASYLQWVPTETLDGIVWDEQEKFYRYAEWLQWVIDYFLRPWIIAANGVIAWSGEDVDDHGQIEVVANNINIIKHDALGVDYLRPLTRDKLADLAIESIAPEKPPDAAGEATEG